MGGGGGGRGEGGVEAEQRVYSLWLIAEMRKKDNKYGDEGA